jgi:hypothetical protein
VIRLNHFLDHAPPARLLDLGLLQLQDLDTQCQLSVGLLEHVYFGLQGEGLVAPAAELLFEFGVLPYYLPEFQFETLKRFLASFFLVDSGVPSIGLYQLLLQ